MNDRTLIFRSVMAEHIESLSPYIIDFVNTFIENSNTTNSSPIKPSTSHSNDSLSDASQIDFQYFDDLFDQFPRNIPIYKDIISRLCFLAQSDADEIIHYLTKLNKEILNSNPSTQYTLLQISQLSTKFKTKKAFLVFYYISNIFLADLICQIILTYYTNQNSQIKPDVVTYLTKTAYNIATTKHELPSISLIVIRQWSVILSLLSEINFQIVVDFYSMFTNLPDLTAALVLMQYARFDLDTISGPVFFESILHSIKNHIKKKTITNEGLIAISKMLVTVPFSEETFTKLYQSVRPLRNDKNLYHGSSILSCALYLRIPSKRNRSHFLQKHVLSCSNDRKKIRTSLICFLMYIAGRNVDVFNSNWEWGPNPRSNKYVWLQYNSALAIQQDDSRSFSNLFMSNYFRRMNFRRCPKLIKKILMHLISLDFAYFTKSILPKFIELADDDIRFILLLKIVPKINTASFWENAFQVSSNYKNLLLSFNNQIRDKVLPALRSCLSTSQEKSHAISFHNTDLLMDSLISEADQKVAEILEEWKLSSVFEETRIRYKIAHSNINRYTLIHAIFPTLKIILDVNDFNNLSLIDILIEYASNSDVYIATTAYEICKNISVNKESYIQMLLVDITSNEDQEFVFTCLSLLENCLRFIDNKIDVNLLFDIESIAFLVMSSTHPTIRHLCLLILNRVNQLLNSQGLLSVLRNHISVIEKEVKTKILLHKQISNISSSIITFDAAILCHFYDVWMFFVAAMNNLLIQFYYEPFFNHIKNFSSTLNNVVFDGYREIRNSDKSALITLLSSMFYAPAIINSTNYSTLKEIENCEIKKVDRRSEICNIVNKVLIDKKSIGFEIIPHLHFSILGPLINVLANSPDIQRSTKTLSLILSLPEIDHYFILHNFHRIVSFLNSVNTFLLENHLNTPKLINHSKNTQVFLNDIDLIINYCKIIIKAFDVCKSLKNEDWPIATREVVFRFLVNWAICANQENISEIIQNAIVTVCKVGPIFSHSPLLDDLSANFIGHIDLNGKKILGNLLYFHFEYLIDNYIRACYVQPITIAETYFNAIVENITERNSIFIVPHIGELLLLAMIYIQRDHSKAIEIVDKLLPICSELDLVLINNDKEMQLISEQIHTSTDLIPQIFNFAVESVIKSFFEITEEYKNLNVPFKDLVYIIRKWIVLLRLLPKQQGLVQNGIPDFLNFFTPFQFLMKLKEVTENVGSDRSSLFLLLWEDLLHSPDHLEIIPIFLTSIINSSLQTQWLFEKLLDTHPEYVLPIVSQRCSFAYFFHCTKCLQQEFVLTHAEWAASLISRSISNFFDQMCKYLPTVLQFVLLFREKGMKSSFQIICSKLGIETHFPMSFAQFRQIIDQLIEKFGQYADFSIEEWGNECLKWLFACDDTYIASNALLIYNRIGKPYDSTIFQYQIVRTVWLHVKTTTGSDFNDLALLISESMSFFSVHIESNYLLIFNYISSFLDSQILPYIELDFAIGFFLQSLLYPELLLLICRNIIPLIRPLIPLIESTKNVQDLLDKCIEKIDNEDIRMIAAPFKKTYPSLFPHLPQYDVLISSVSDNALCNSLIHYAMLVDTVSRPVLNSIFEISAMIVNKVVRQTDENNKNPLTKLYQHAMRSMNKCSSAFLFICAISKNQPQVVSNEVVESFVWTRSIEDVSRSIRIVLDKFKQKAFGDHDFHFYARRLSGPQLINNSKQENSYISLFNISKLTDCKSYTSVLNFLYIGDDDLFLEVHSSHSNSSLNEYTSQFQKPLPSLFSPISHNKMSKLPKILPFAAQQEMIEAMQKIHDHHAKFNPADFIRHDKSSDQISNIPQSTSIIFIPSQGFDFSRISVSGKVESEEDSENSDHYRRTSFIYCAGMKSFRIDSDSMIQNISPLKHPKCLQSDDNMYDKNVLQEKLDNLRQSFEIHRNVVDFFGLDS